jgi:two-component system, cell cycle response regulator
MSRPKCRILCIDDHEDTSEMLQLILANEDYKVATAPTAKQALEMAATEEFDLYVLDRHLPDASGLELCQKLAEVTPGVPCIFYTGDAYEIQRHEAIAAGADGYVAKPDIDKLIESVHQLLADKECSTATV